MNRYLKSYQVVMRSIGPVFIGSGREISKKEYIFLNRNQVGMIDAWKMYDAMKRRKKEAVFEEYILGSNNINLNFWLKKQGIEIKEIKPFVKYTLDCGDAIIEKGSNRLQVMECIKDAYGNPYIPGSSLKGMFRTVLLGADILKNPQKYQNEKQNLKRNVDLDRSNRNSYLKRDTRKVEEIAYRILNKNEKKTDDAVNDVLQGLIISDSEPLRIDSLVLCQKIDLHTDGMERNLPILRECIKPDTEIKFTITVDTSICNLTDVSLMEAVKVFMESYNKNFVVAFGSIEMSGENEVLCGGGCGFVSKTMVYPMYGKTEGIAITQKIFDKTNVPRVHKHYRDKEYGASPHIMKCTKYEGKLYQMGKCRIETMQLM